MIDTRLLPLIIGRNAEQITKIKFDLEFQLHNFGRIGGMEYGISAIDIALWDLLGKSSGLPLARLLGGAFVDELEVYASLMRYGTTEAVTKAVRRAVDRGYRYIKLHEVEMGPIRAAVEAAGPEVAVMLDTNCPWSVPEALRIDRELVSSRADVVRGTRVAARELQRACCGEDAGQSSHRIGRKRGEPLRLRGHVRSGGPSISRNPTLPRRAG